jgi:lipopolysaccharide biosynthesis glycosyltransferase
MRIRQFSSYAIPVLGFLALSSCILCYVGWIQQQKNLLFASQILHPSSSPSLSIAHNKPSINSTMAVASLFTGNHDTKGRYLTQSACKLARQVHRFMDVHLVLIMSISLHPHKDEKEAADASALAFRLCGWRDQRMVQPIHGPTTSPYYAHANVFTKLHLWNLVDFSKLLYLDLDTLPIAPFHSLFTIPLHGHIGMVNDLGLAAPDATQGPFNAGVIVLHPNAALFQALVQNITLLQYNSDLADQSYLNAFFAGQITVLPSTYNALISRRDVWPPHVTIVHYTWIKPWESWSCFWNGIDDMAAVWHMA